VSQCNGWLLLQARQIAFCNATHHAPDRISRWLLRASDVLGITTDLPFTQEMIGTALGLRRTTVTQAVDLLKGAKSQHGKISIDRDALGETSCDCCHAFARGNWPASAARAEKPAPVCNGAAAALA
jgi:hypothetical protein